MVVSMASLQTMNKHWYLEVDGDVCARCWFAMRTEHANRCTCPSPLPLAWQTRYNAHMGFFSMHGRYNAHMGLNTDKKWFREAFKQHVQYAVNAVVVSDQDRTSMSAAPDLSDGTDSVENRSNSVEHSEQAGGSGSSSNGYIDLGPSPSIWSGPRLGVFNAPWLD